MCSAGKDLEEFGGRFCNVGTELEDGADLEAVMRVGRRYNVKTPIARQRRPETWWGLKLKLAI